MNITNEYQKKIMTAEVAAALVKSGDWIDYGWSTGTPVDIDAALAKRLPELFDIKFRGALLLWKPKIFSIDNPGEHFIWNSWHMGGYERRAAQAGFVFYSPMRFAELPRYYRDLPEPIDVAYVQVAPMDEHGFFNFGPNATYYHDMLERSEKVIVEVNAQMPRCLGGFEEKIHVSSVDGIVEGSNSPIGYLKAPETTEVDKIIAGYIVDEIPNGACLQLGIGGMPNAVGKMIADSELKDLGIHTEMYVDAFTDIAATGKITGRRKAIGKYKQTYSFAAGTQKTYDYLNDNPECEMAPIDYVNDVRNIAKIDNFISINNAVEVDVYGQVSSESIRFRHLTGTGGQLDFVMGAYLSAGGKSFICLSSTFLDKDGEMKSRIVPALEQGSIVTDPRTTTHFVVTEYGKANLKGMSNWQRAEALINIAHPDFRNDLIAKAEKMRIWRKSNKR